MKVLSSRQYCRETGFCWKTIKDLCKAGIMPYIPHKNGYYLEIEVANEVMRGLAKNLHKPIKIITNPPRNHVGDQDFLARLKSLKGG